jgi:uncharacterized cupredoxin-like copper-binding protein
MQINANVMSKILTTFVVAITLNAIVLAQNAKRIDFVKAGSNALVWEERVAANSSKSFVFYAKKGQKLSLSMIDDTNKGSMDLGKISIEPNADPLEMVIEVTKDYTFSVSNNSNKSTSFRISISLDNAKSSAKPASTGSSATNAEEEIQFPKGKITVNLKRTINANGSIDFTFHARKGQRMVYSANYNSDKNEDLALFLTEPDSQDISSESAANEPNEFIIKKSGYHKVTVNNKTRKKLTFDFGLTIK